MLNVIIITLVVISLSAVQVPHIIKNKLYKELAVSVALISIALIYSYSEVLDWKLPGPTKFIEVIFDPVSKIVFGEKYTYP